MTDLEMSQKQEEWLDNFSLLLFLCHNISPVSSIRSLLSQLFHLELELLFCTKTICYPCYRFLLFGKSFISRFEYFVILLGNICPPLSS